MMTGISMTPDDIRAIRATLGESTRDFAARFRVSHRTVEAWEQGRNRPHPTVLRALDLLRAQQKEQP